MKYGPIRRTVFFVGAVLSGLFALAAFDIVANPTVLNGARLLAAIFCAALLMPTYVLALKAWTGRP